MIAAPDLTQVGGVAELREAIVERFGTASARGVIVVGAVGCEAEVRRLAADVEASFTWIVRREPAIEDFLALETAPCSFPAGVVIAVGGGAAIDAAKAVALWGSHYASVEGLAKTLEAEQVLAGRETKLVVLPTLASSGSEASRGAILEFKGRKRGLRGPALQADLVCLWPGLWANLPVPLALGHAYDIFAHLVETCVSRKAAAEVEAEAQRGMGYLLRWLSSPQLALAQYELALRAAFSGGLCLAHSSTCLPHRIQYVLGPATKTGHAAGIAYLERNWLPLASRAVPERFQQLARAFGLEAAGFTGLPHLAQRVREVTGHEQIAEPFRLAPEMVRSLVGQTSGDLSADPCYRGPETIEAILTGEQIHG